MSYFEDIGDEWIETLDHILFSINTLGDAEQYVKQVIHMSSKQEIAEYVDTFVGTKVIKTKKQGQKRKRGGGEYIQCDDRNDVRIYKFLAALDTIHDICKRTETGRWKYGLGIDDVLKSISVSPIDGISKEMMMDEQKTIDFLDGVGTLNINGDVLPSPVYKNGINSFDYTRYKRLSSYVSNFDKERPPTERNNYLCIVGQDTSKKLPAKQILELLKNIKLWFGNTCDFILDSDHKVTKIFNALCLIDEAWYNILTDKSKNFSEFIKHMKEITVSKTHWNAYITDAKMFDGMPHQAGMSYDPRPTGWIYRHDAAVFNICLKGIDTNYRVRFSSTDGEEQCIDRSDADIQHTTNMLFYKTNNVPRAMSYKRGGDWGQIEHCQRYDKVFVTFDRLAALYAYYRGVKFIFIRCIWRKADNSWVQLAFTTSRPFKTNQ